MNEQAAPTWQAQAAEFSQKHNLHRSAGVYALDLLSELGELAKELLLATSYGERPFPAHPQNQSAISSECGDILYSLCQLANTLQVDLDDAFAQTLAKYEARWNRHQSPGSAAPSTNVPS